MFQQSKILYFAVLLRIATALRWSEEYVGYNLNENETATEPLDYYGKWDNHTFHPSPDNWRFPFYTIFLDTFVNGDPNNDNINGTKFEHDIMQTQLRHGGDIQGVIDSLDYIQGMGIKALYVAGSPFINEPWGADSYSPLDLTLLDLHYGNIAKYREMVTEIHKRGMYIIADNTMATMGNLNMAEQYQNTSTPFSLSEHKQAWRDPNRQYLDFKWSNEYNDTCEYPRFYLETGYEVGEDVRSTYKGCYNSEFDHYGDVEAFGVFPDWMRQLAKFASVQDRLREWHDPVRAKIKHFACLTVLMLDIDGFRLDKATQITVDALGDWSHDLRECAKSVNKTNFFIPGEITGGNTFGSIYVGRGRNPDMSSNLTITEAITLTSANDSSLFIRDKGQNALDSAAFHYSVYRSLTRFLGMDGNLAAGYDVPLNWVNAWNEMLITNDFVNANTGEVDIRHMYGVANQDVFRWPAIANGTQRQLLGEFIATLHMPGIPMMLWGEEQAFYILDNTASNYVFGRQAMSSSVAWQTHGCYTLGAEQYYQFPIEAALTGCADMWNSKDHRDPSAPVRNTLKAMYEMRQNYPVLNDGIFLQQLSNMTREVYYPGSGGVATETGIWSVVRGEYEGVQNLTSSGGQGNQSVWLVYTNENASTSTQFDCSSETTALISPFPANTTVKNLFYPHDEYNLTSSSQKLYLYGSTDYNGCLEELDLPQYGFKAFVPKDAFVEPTPVITKFSPGHDYRILSTVKANEQEVVPIEIHFSTEMDCEGLKGSIELNSTTENGEFATLDNSTVTCENITAEFANSFVGTIPGTWKFSANLTNVSNGIHSLTVRNVSNKDQTSYTGSVDKFLFRVGQTDNPMVFPFSANYTYALLHQYSNGTLYISHKAAGADYWRYSLDWTTYSDWMPYLGGNSTLQPKNWTGTERQAWEGEHIIAQYYSQMTGSADYQQHADLSPTQTPRRLPHLFAHGAFNQYGYDAGLANELKQDGGGIWRYNFMTEWTGETLVQLNIWGMNPDGQPDQTGVLSDVDDDGVLDRMAPSSLATKAINITSYPAWPHLGYLISVNDADYRYTLTPMGSQWTQLGMYLIMLVVPIVTAVLSVWLYMKSFYSVKFNTNGVTEKSQFIPLAIRRRLRNNNKESILGKLSIFPPRSTPKGTTIEPLSINTEIAPKSRRTVLIATMEYDIEDWAIKIKIGGLGVMAQLMGKSLSSQDLIWVVPCVGGIDYPEDTPAESMFVTILGQQYEVKVQYHQLRNITYVLLDAPVFRAQSKAIPYPARMDDLESGIYYSTWNQCIAEASKRFPVDLYHINDYHGAVAPLYLLPERTIPCALSLHNAEFQGLWPLRSAQEHKEVCEVFNLTPEVVQKYVQFGDVFNLLHAAVSYLRVHQKGFGAVGVSKKYGARSHARYPIFWGLDKIGQLPNPDPSDTAEWTGEEKKEVVKVDEEFESARPELKRQAQEWAQLKQDPDAELLVFVGRWSMQKGIDLIADVMPNVLETNPRVQVICVGPQIDLYGKFAALKLDVMMKKYPGRVYSKPEFTALPPFIFSGAEFALIPSRDEPFGLVAVEFGRKGALGIGARVGGLGQMPGWWFTVESTTTSHMLHQFKMAIKDALASSTETRRIMRAKSAKQRFPVAQWIGQLEKLQSAAIKIHDKEALKRPATALSRPTTSYGRSPGLNLGVFSRPRSPNPAVDSEDDYTSTPSTPGRRTPDVSRPASRMGLTLPVFAPKSIHSPRDSDYLESPAETPSEILTPNDPTQSDYFLQTPGLTSRSISMLSLSSIVGEKTDFQLQKIDPDFTDGRGEYYKTFEQSLDKLTGGNSEDLLCIETFLMKSQKTWYGQFRDAKMGTTSATPTRHRSSSFFGAKSIAATEVLSIKRSNSNLSQAGGMGAAQPSTTKETDEWLLGADYAPPTGIEWFMSYRVGDWPVYSFFVAFGQIIAANSYQISLLTGSVGQTADRLYEIAGVYLATSAIWWCMFISLKSVYNLSIPFFFYGLAFLLLGTAPFASESHRNTITLIATLLYATGSSSGSIFFAVNFGDEGGSPVQTWVLRSCIIQGIQTIYITALWAWGSYLTKQSSLGFTGTTINSGTKVMAAIAIPVAILLWVVGVLIYLGMPKYYRQQPGKVPSFYRSLFRRKIVLWFFFYVLVQNFFLSSMTGRNWSYLWSSSHAKVWQIILLVIVFFIGVWIALLSVFYVLSKDHSWILPIFAIGLIAPRWAQILWSCSNIGAWVPWAGGPVASALAGRSLWLWLGTLDTVQGVGVGMILLQTLTRVHIASTLTAAQMLGSLATIVARACGPNKLGPGDVFPDFTPGAYPGVGKAWFWIGLIFQCIICAGFFRFFRKEQLSKP